MADLHRIQFNFTKEALEELDELKESAFAPSRAEVIRWGLRLVQWVIEQSRNGTKIIIEKDGALREVNFPFLAVQPKKQA